VDITFNCAKCQQHLVIEEVGAGLSVQCPRCGQALTVPAAKADIVIHAESAIAAAAKAIESGIFDDDQKLDAYLKKSSPEVLAAVYGKKHAKAFLEGKISGKELMEKSKFKLSREAIARLRKKFRDIDAGL
jgi:phage FluMu protein Com